MVAEDAYAWASGLVCAMLRAPHCEGISAAVLEPENYNEETKDAVCMAQQIVAEATGLVGLPEVYETNV